jgi:hypothetical protein
MNSIRTPIVPLCCLLGFAALLLGACTSADKCERGQIGCVPTMQNRCTEGRLVDGMCVPNTSTNDAGTDAGGRDAGGPPPIECSDDSLLEGCTAFCEAFCQNQILLCVESTCPVGACEPDGAFYQGCADVCEAEADPAGCAQEACMGQIGRACERFGFEDDMTGFFTAGCLGDDPVCVLAEDFGCSVTCGELENGTGGDLSQNGVCEDGGEGSTADSCPRGTDCADCGTRTCAMAGDDCGVHGDCCGYYGGGAFCVDLRPQTDAVTCLATCTEDRNSCPSGFTCTPVDDNENYVCAP